MLDTISLSHEAWKGRVCWRRRISPTVTYEKNDCVLMPKGEFKLASDPNPAWPGSVRGGARACGEPSMS